MLYTQRGFLTPVEVQRHNSFSSGTFTVIFPVTPTPGNLMLASFGATTAKTVSPPSGWTEVTAAIVAGSPRPLANHTFYKVAGIGESNSYPFAPGGGGNLSCSAIEFFGLTPVFTYLDTKANTTATTYTSASFNIPGPGVAWFNLAKNSGSVWTWSPPYPDWLTVTGSGNCKAGYKVYSGSASSQVATCGPGTSETYNAIGVHIQAKRR